MFDAASSGPAGERRTTSSTPGSRGSQISVGCGGVQVGEPLADVERGGRGPRGRRRCRLGDGPRHARPVHPAVVGGVGGFVGPAQVVEQAELVAHPEHGQAAEAEHHGVGEQDARDGTGVVALRPASDASEPLIRRSPVASFSWKTSPRAHEPG